MDLEFLEQKTLGLAQTSVVETRVSPVGPMPAEGGATASHLNSNHNLALRDSPKAQHI
jgi:hypothetical protein